MARALKIVGVILFTLVALLVAGVIVVTRLVDPNDYKPRIQALAKEHGNLDLRFEGELAWSFWPSLGVDLGRTEARIAGTEELFAAFDRATVGIAVWPLLFGEIRMDEVMLDAVELNLVQLPDGANWERIGPAGASAEEPAPQKEPAAEGGGADVALFVPELNIRNARVRYREPAQDTDILVENVNLRATNISLDQPFRVSLSFRYQDQSDMRIDGRIAATASADLERNLFRGSALDMTFDIGGLTASPVTVQIAGESAEVALDEDRASLRDIRIAAAGVTTSIGADVEQMSTTPVIRGKLETRPFDANVALRNLGMDPISTSDQAALRKVALQATLGGEPGSVMLDPLVITLDDTTIRGRAGITDLETLAILFDLALDRLVADGYLPPETGIESDDAPPAADTAGATAPGSGILPPLSDEPLLPLEDLRTLIVDGRLVLGEILLDDIAAGDIRIEVSARDGRLGLEVPAGTLAGGTLRASGSLDATGEQPPIAFRATLQGVNAGPLAKYGVGRQVVSGNIDADLRLDTRGNTERALLTNASGMFTFGMANALLHGVSLHAALMDGATDLLGSVSGLAALLPGQESAKLPRELREDTRLADLAGKARLERETVWVDALTASLEDGEMKGEGFLNLRSGEFDLQLGVRSARFTDNRYFANRTWPVRCRGELDGNPARWCGPDTGRFREMGREIVTEAAKDKLKEKLGVEGEGSTSEAVRDAAKKKAQEELERKARDELKKLLR